MGKVPLFEVLILAIWGMACHTRVAARAHYAQPTYGRHAVAVQLGAICLAMFDHVRP